MAKIESLTDAQWAEVTRKCEEWAAMAATGTTDRETTEKVMTAFYAKTGRKPPRFHWYRGPLECVQAIGKIQVELGSKKTWQQEALDALSHGFFFGPEWSGWVFRYKTCRELGVEIDEESSAALDQWIALSQATGWCFTYEDEDTGDSVVFVAERHKSVTFDANQCLHSTGDAPHLQPAVVCGDGVTMYAWHGIRLPREWFEPELTLTAEVALQCRNAEQRRAAVEILGWETILASLPSRIIDQHQDPKIGTLLEVDLPDAPNSRFLRVQCGTGRMFAIATSREAKTALQAQAMAYDVSEETILAMEVRT